MTNPQTLLEPPVEAIKGGYWITQARLLLRDHPKYEKTSVDHAHYFMLEGLRYLEKAVDIVADETGMFFMQPGPGMRPLYDAVNELSNRDLKLDFLTRRRICWLIAEGHEHLRRLMLELGYRTITNDDFKTYGDGGGR